MKLGKAQATNNDSCITITAVSPHTRPISTISAVKPIMSSTNRYDTRQRRALYGPSATARRSTIGYWVPLVLTLTVATAGLAAWIWSERQGDEDDNDNGYTSDEHDRPDYPERPPPEGQYGPPLSGSGFDEPPPSYPPSSAREATGEEEGFMSRMSGAVRRTPSPQQFFDSAGQRIVAGVAAAGAAVGLGSIREESAHARSREREEGFSDHERWNEEVESKRVEAQSSQSSEAVTAHTDAFNASVNRSAPPSGKNKTKKTVAVVLSADTSLDSFNDEDDVEYRTEHAVRYHISHPSCQPLLTPPSPSSPTSHNTSTPPQPAFSS